MRTTLVDDQGNPRYTNRLIHESSPYLVQHAHNPVDWYPWGDEAFQRARDEDKPVFLSIGYSTCHWCHVMEAESFDSEEIAAILNAHFIAIKLDREQRPDIDDIYMTGVQMLTGQGGWPMSNFLTPVGKPFYAGTYYPPANFKSLLEQIASLWQERRAEVDQQAEQIAEGINRFVSARADSISIDSQLYQQAFDEILARFDGLNGGFGGAPKFPNEAMLSLLLDASQRTSGYAVDEALTLTLDKMYQGGIHDQVGGGFHRYTVDAIWLVPHFEKMLYNQAQLLRIYGTASRVLRQPEWSRVAVMLVDYLFRDMTDDRGTFYSATDADSEGQEGFFFLWTIDELDGLLSANDVEMVRQVYQVTEAGNFEGRNILHPGRSMVQIANELGMEASVFLARLDRIRSRLYLAREQREHPLRDEKIITGWNGMMITALASAGVELAIPAWVEAAERAANALWDSVYDDGLWRISMAGERSVRANLEDYACLAEALLALYGATGAAIFRERAGQLVAEMIELFWDAGNGGFFLSRPKDEGPMISRPKSPMDGATPSANSTALHVLVGWWRATGDVDTEQKIVSMINAFSGLISATPSAFPAMMVAIADYRQGQCGVIQFAGGGAVRVVMSRHDTVIELHIYLADGWHVNSNRPTDQELVPTRVEVISGDDDSNVTYPLAEDIWSDNVVIVVDGDPRQLALTLQPCNGSMCLGPETLSFYT